MQSSPSETYDMERATGSSESLVGKSEATHKALNTFELVKMVVEYLPPTSVVAVQRVGRIWNNVSKGVIKRSEYLTDRLSTIPASRTFELQYKQLPSLYNRFTLDIRAADSESTHQPEDYVMIICKVHPAFAVENADGKLAQGLHLSIDLTKLLSWRPGPWRDMFVTQPPITLGSLYTAQGPAGQVHTKLREVMDRDTAVTLGALQDAVRRSLGLRMLPKSKYIFPTRIMTNVFVDRLFIQDESVWVRSAREHPERIFTREFWQLRSVEHDVAVEQ